MDEHDSEDGEDNLEREVNKIINEGFTDEQSLTEAESDSDSVLCTLSTDIEDVLSTLCTHIGPDLFYRYFLYLTMEQLTFSYAATTVFNTP